MKFQLCASNALNKYLKADLPRLPYEPGKQAGVNTLISDNNCFNWQLQIVDNSYKSRKKTIIVCEANSRFTFFIPVNLKLSQQELTQRVQYEWQFILAETREVYQLITCSDIAVLLSELSKIEFTPHWVKNTDLSICGHISDAVIWVTQTLKEEGIYDLPKALAIELAIYLNTQPKRITNKATGRKEKFLPIERLLTYCQSLITDRQSDHGQ
ncbi:amino acid adenylation [Pseudoalteromonas sp. SG43-5]|uniref:amino acid adenylation n=1 Tax=Pseudoalteromonas sp. SG43-5 TaxID=2760968 RepID=UPI0015FF11DE|nr:amino acid adenylation [Pseudoalteromonas sp. SG43-5]MBB1454597.1 amino acid adenylation [Pseudoalteromonas sp. SG43-5]